MANYIEILGSCFPNAQAYIIGNKDPSDYNSLQWVTPPIPQSVLDASPCAGGILAQGNVIQFTYGDTNGNSLQTNLDSFTRLRTFQFTGTSVDGAPQQIRFTTWCDEGSTGTIRLLDVTNSNVICEMEIINTVEDIIICTETHNWPSALSLIEVQMKKTSGNHKKNVYLSGLSLVY